MKDQIEEMAKELCGTKNECKDCQFDKICISQNCATIFYNAGYRKQSEGEWVKVMNHKECSECGYKAPYRKIKAGYHLLDLSRYCPNCGAKMKGV